MTTDEIIKFLEGIPLGTYVSIFSVIAMIIGAVSGGIIYLYKIFEKTKKVQDENDSFKRLVAKHDEQLTEILKAITEINKTLEEKKKTDLKKLRHSIVRAGEEAINNRCITIRQLRSLEELYDEYEHKYNANGYVKTLMKKVRNVKVIGQLDENDDDIENDDK